MIIIYFVSSVILAQRERNLPEALVRLLPLVLQPALVLPGCLQVTVSQSENLPKALAPLTQLFPVPPHPPLQPPGLNPTPHPILKAQEEQTIGLQVN